MVLGTGLPLWSLVLLLIGGLIVSGVAYSRVLDGGSRSGSRERSGIISSLGDSLLGSRDSGGSSTPRTGRVKRGSSSGNSGTRTSISEGNNNFKGRNRNAPMGLLDYFRGNSGGGEDAVAAIEKEEEMVEGEENDLHQLVDDLKAEEQNEQEEEKLTEKEMERISELLQLMEDVNSHYQHIENTLSESDGSLSYQNLKGLEEEIGKDLQAVQNDISKIKAEIEEVEQIIQRKQEKRRELDQEYQKENEILERIEEETDQVMATEEKVKQIIEGDLQLAETAAKQAASENTFEQGRG